MNNLKIIDNSNERQYEVKFGDQVAKIEYIKAKDKIYLTHTEVPVALEGNGIGSQLVHMALQDIEQKDLTLIPLCPFVAGYIKNHPEWKKLVLKGINIK